MHILSPKGLTIVGSVAIAVIFVALAYGFIDRNNAVHLPEVSNGYTYPQHIAALGDSMTIGVNADKRGDNRNLSWASGSDDSVKSIAKRIQEETGQRPIVENVAVGGAESAGLKSQANKVVKTDATFAVILIGANDVCSKTIESMTSAAAFEQNISDALEVLKAKGVAIVLASTVDVTQLLSIGESSSAARTVWNRANICQSLLAGVSSNASESNARKEVVLDRVAAYNQVLQSLCTAYGDNCTYDNGAVFETNFTSEELSKLDYFHPSAKGQRKLAESLWPVLQLAFKQ